MAHTDMERRILDMWPKFEDGSYVWFGDDVGEIDARSFVFLESGAMVTNLTSVPAYGKFIRCSEPLKRPAPKVLDADGVEIKVGDTVWHEDGTMLRVDGFGGIEDGETIVNVHVIRGAVPWIAVRSLSLTHVQPDSWERLKDDATMSPWSYCDKYGLVYGLVAGISNDEYFPATVAFATDLIRRAKALAEKEAGR